MSGKPAPLSRSPVTQTHLRVVPTTFHAQGEDQKADHTAHTEATRRSGRATKGVTTKNQEAEAAEQKPKKGKAKPVKKGSQQAEQEEDDDEEENAIIRCICGQYEEDDEPRTMVCCDKCSAWQHNDCMGITEDEDELPEHYFCEQCKPQDHKPLLAAMARGERPWEAAQQRREEIERQRKQKKGKKGKGGRQSKAQELSREPVDGEASEVASPTMSEGNKRKLEDNSVEQEQVRLSHHLCGTMH